MDIFLHEKQRICFFSSATEILYGGAAGGGKSYLMRIEAIVAALSVRGIQVYLFRRHYADLIKNHMDGASGFRVLLGEMILAKQVRIREDYIAFGNGAKIHLCHCQHEKDVYKYQGAEINLLLIDELTHFSEFIFKFLRGRVRLGSLVIPPQVQRIYPRILAGSNPGGIGHIWVRDYFINNVEPFTIRPMPDRDGGMLRQYIPAQLADNPTMMASDPFYSAKLMGLGGALAKAMLEGDWDVMDGAFFEKFNTNVHVISEFEIPQHWYRIRSFDWGYSAPFCVGWYAVSDGAEWEGRYLPPGALIKYREWYGGTIGKNTGLRLENDVIARHILKLEDGEKIDDSVADPAIFAQNGGESIASQMFDNGINFRRADNQRIPGWQQIRYRLAAPDNPMLFLFSGCYATIQGLSSLLHDTHRIEDVNTNMEDHAADETRYACMSRPLTINPVLDFPREDNKIYVCDEIEKFKKRLKNEFRYNPDRLS